MTGAPELPPIAVERARMLRQPPDILITTPESLFLVLTSRARGFLASVETVIVDEIHAVVGTKRGAHLALSLERLERAANPVDLSVREPGADVPRPVEAVRLASSEDEGAELRASTRPTRVAHDRKVLLVAELDLPPLGRPPPRAVRAVRALRDDALETVAAGRGHERLALADDVRGEPNPWRLLDHRSQQALAVLERDLEERPTVEIKEIEHLVDERSRSRARRLVRPGRCRGRGGG